jgi:hypothetical protein
VYQGFATPLRALDTPCGCATISPPGGGANLQQPYGKPRWLNCGFDFHFQEETMSSKNVQIPYDLFLSIYHIFNDIDPETLPESTKRNFQKAHMRVKDKAAAIRNREAFTEVKHSGNKEEREQALENYINTKKMNTRNE